MGNRQDFSAEKQSLKDKLTAIILLETSKDYKEMDSDLVTECVDFLMELEGEERLTQKEIEQRVKEIPFKGKATAIGSYTKKKLRAKRLAIIAAILAIIIALFGIIAIASGSSSFEFMCRMAKSIHEMFDGTEAEYGDITVIKPTETKTYSSVEEFAKDEGIEILYPSWLPENEKIVSIMYLFENGVESYTYINSTPEHSIEFKVNTELAEEVKSDCIQKEIAGYSVYYQEASQFIQANFVYENDLYLITSDTEDNLFKIIENLKEIN